MAPHQGIFACIYHSLNFKSIPEQMFPAAYAVQAWNWDQVPTCPINMLVSGPSVQEIYNYVDMHCICAVLVHGMRSEH